MKKVILCAAIIGGSIISGQANAAPLWYKLNSFVRGGPSGYEKIAHAKKFESMQFDQSVQWDRPELHRDKEAVSRMSRMRDVSILKKHKYEWDKIPMVTVGTNFYHLTGEDMQQVLKDFDTAYNYTDNGRTYIRIKDSVTKEEVGIYSNGQLFLQ